MAAPTPQAIKQAQDAKTAAIATAVAMGYIPPQEYPLPTPFAADKPLPFAHSIDLRNLSNPQYSNVSAQTKQHPLFGYSVRGVCIQEPHADTIDSLNVLLVDAPRTGGLFRIVLSTGAVINCQTGATINPQYKTTIQTDFTTNNDFGNYTQGIAGIISTSLKLFVNSWLSVLDGSPNQTLSDAGRIILEAHPLNATPSPQLFHIKNSYLFENTTTINAWTIGNLPTFQNVQIFEQVEIQRQGDFAKQRICAFSCSNRALFELVCVAITCNNSLIAIATASFIPYIQTIFKNNPQDWECQIITENILQLINPKQSQFTIAYLLLDLQAGMLARGLSVALASSEIRIIEQCAKQQNTFLYQEVKAIRQLMHNTFFANNKNEATQLLVLDTLKALNYQLPLIINATPEKQQQALHAVMANYSLQQIMQTVKWQIMCMVPKPTDAQSQSIYTALLASIDKISNTLAEMSLTLTLRHKKNIKSLLQPMLDAIRKFQPPASLLSSLFPPNESFLYSELQTLHGKLYLEMLNIRKCCSQILVQRESESLAEQQRALQYANSHPTGDPGYTERFSRT